MNVPGFMIAGIKSGSGKTLITCGIVNSLIKKGYKTVSAKAGPDYIDPLFHRMINGIKTMNLDTFFSGDEDVLVLYNQGSKGADIVVTEGVMGLYDGLGGVGPEGSSYDLARALKLPIILVADVKGMGRSMIPLIKGFTDYDQEGLIKGVILNKITKGFYDNIKPVLERELSSVKLFGYVPENREYAMDSRHLGLSLPEGEKEKTNVIKSLAQISEDIEKTIDIDGIIAAAGKDLNCEEKYENNISYKNKEDSQPPDIIIKKDNNRPVVALAKDDAFCFYYEENLYMLRERGVSIKEFSPLKDKTIPDDSVGIILGGGYPELYAQKLSSNKSMLFSIKNALEGNMPSLAECGGFMYLHKAMEDTSGYSHSMANVIDASVYKTSKSIRFGYMELEMDASVFAGDMQRVENTAISVKDIIIRGHEFHYYESTCPGEDALAVKPIAKTMNTAKNVTNGKEIQNTRGSRPCCHLGKGQLWGFPHLYYPSCPEFVDIFIANLRNYMSKGKAV